MRKNYDASVYMKINLIGDSWESTVCIRNTVFTGSTTAQSFVNMANNEKCRSIVIGNGSALSQSYFGVGTIIEVYGR